MCKAFAFGTQHWYTKSNVIEQSLTDSAAFRAYGSFPQGSPILQKPKFGYFSFKIKSMLSSIITHWLRKQRMLSWAAHLDTYHIDRYYNGKIWERMGTKVLSLVTAMNARRAEEVIRKIAVNDTAIQFTTHAQERMEERDISLADVVRVLRNGTVEEPPKAGKGKDEWKAKVIRHQRGCRDIGVVTLVVRESTLLILTVEWEDL